MALSKEVCQEQLNYFRVCHLAVKIIPEKLRILFKREWNTRYGSTHGNWDDTSKNGSDFYSLTTPTERKQKKVELSVIKNGNTNEWDGTCLFYAILYSDCIGNKGLAPTVKKSLDTLRKFRNKDFAHAKDDRIVDPDFQSSVQGVVTALQDVKFEVSDITDLKDKRTFPTDELRELKSQLAKERQRYREVPALCQLPPKPFHEVTIRDKEVSKICKEMENLRKANEDKVTVTYLSGNPGCGKSELSRQIGQKYFDEETDFTKFVMTLDASSIDSLWFSYIEFVSLLDCNDTSINQIVTMQNESIENKLSYLQKELMSRALQKYSSWLIIVDNVEDLKMVSKYIPQAGQQGNGHIIVTTQDTKPIPRTTSDRNHFPLNDGMQSDDAAKTLLTISNVHESNSHIMDRVAKALNHQPLALACAAMWMQESVSIDPSIAWTTYLPKLYEGSLHTTEYVYKAKQLNYNKTMTTAVKMALEVKVAANEILKYVFQFLSVIALERIPIKYIIDYVQIHLPREDRLRIASEIKSSSLIRTSEEDSIVMVRVHQIVYHVLSQQTFQSRESKDFTFLLNVVKVFVSGNQAEADIKSVPSLFIHLSKIVEHVAVCFSNQPSDTWRQKIYSLLNISTGSLTEEMANCLEELFYSDNGNVNTHENLFRLMLRINFSVSDRISIVLTIYAMNLSLRLRERGLCVFASNLLESVLPLVKFDEFKALLLSCHATIVTQLGNFEYAYELSVRSLDVMENHSDSEDIAFCLFMTHVQNNHGVVLKDMGRYKQSIRAFIHSLNYLNTISDFFNRLEYPILQRLTATLTHAIKTRTATVKSNLGLSLQELGEYDRALDILNNVLQINERSDWADRSSLAATLRVRALVFRDLAKYHEAKSELKRAIAIKESEEQRYDTNTNPWLARMLRDLAFVLQHLGKFEEARDFLERAQAIEVSIKHPNLASTLSRLASVSSDFGEYDQAENLLKRALDIQQNAFKTGHPNIAITLRILASVLQKRGKYEQAKSHLEKAMEIQKKSFDENHPSVAITFAMYASVLHDLGRYEEAKERLETVLAVQERIHDKDHPSIAVTLCIYASVLQDLNQHEPAISFLERAKSIQEKTFQCDDHPSVAITLTFLASIYHDQGDHTKAKTLLENALSIQEETFARDHPDIANTLRILASVLHDIGQYNHAKEHLDRALKIMEKVYDENHPYLASTLSHLALVLQIVGDIDQAKELLDRVLLIEQTTCTGNHPTWASTLHNLVQVLHGFGREQEAKVLLKRVTQKGASWD